MNLAYLGLGSNLGDREANLRRAIDLLKEKVWINKVSSLYETEPLGWGPQPLFLNAVCQGTTFLSPQELLAFIKSIEKAMGRAESFRNAPRIIDIDILLYSDRIINTPELTIPHPRLEERAFVLVPLAEIAPELVHPVSRKAIKDLAEKATGLGGVKRVKFSPPMSP